MVSGSSNPTVIPTIPSDLSGSDQSKMVAAPLEVLISPLVHMLARSGATELPDPENVVLSFEIALVANLQAEI